MTTIANWDEDSTEDLIYLWGNEETQARLEGTHRNKEIFQEISAQLKSTGKNFTWEQCRSKIKVLRFKYRSAKKENGKSGAGRDDFK